MHQYLSEHLGIISDEEQKILNGSNCVEKHIYTDTQDFIVDFRKMSRRHRLINVRPHTRFIHFPVHRHDYIEIVWVYAGSMTHVINGVKAIKLEKGDLLFLNREASHEVLPCDRQDLAVNILARPEFFDRSFFAQAPDSGRFFDFVFAQGAKPKKETYIHFPTSGVLPVQNLSENLIWNVLNQPNPNRDVERPTMALLMSHLFNHLE
ncbi:MAG: AraC family ligand binding domain-containing protein [Deltaproteobacteria bacterium]|jgi:hypothetical protein|nr:AraC family ligand binding domain-containing protein [Deltaproteobacteria bacterium]